MRSQYAFESSASTPIARTDLRSTEQDFGSILADVARLLWPAKTAANLAAACGCTERAAEYWLANERPFSGDAIAAIVAEVLRRHAMRNVKIQKR